MSMDCPKCAYKGRCLDSRRCRDGSVTRRYGCLKEKCDWRWTTTEVVVSQGLVGERGVGRGNLTICEIRDRKALSLLLKRHAKDLA